MSDYPPGTPPWVLALSKDIRTFVQEGREDRKQAAEDRRQAAEDRKHWMARWEEDRKEAAEDRKEMVQAFVTLTHVLTDIHRTQRKQTAILETNTRLLKSTHLLLRRVLANGRFGGNGRIRINRRTKPS